MPRRLSERCGDPACGAASRHSGESPSMPVVKIILYNRPLRTGSPVLVRLESGMLSRPGAGMSSTIHRNKKRDQLKVNPSVDKLASPTGFEPVLPA